MHIKSTTHKTMTKNAVSFESVNSDRNQTHWCGVACYVQYKKLRKSVHVTFARICRIADRYAIRTVDEIQQQHKINKLQSA